MACKCRRVLSRYAACAGALMMVACSGAEDRPPPPRPVEGDIASLLPRAPVGTGAGAAGTGSMPDADGGLNGTGATGSEIDAGGLAGAGGGGGSGGTLLPMGGAGAGSLTDAGASLP